MQSRRSAATKLTAVLMGGALAWSLVTLGNSAQAAQTGDVDGPKPVATESAPTQAAAETGNASSDSGVKSDDGSGKGDDSSETKTKPPKKIDISEPVTNLPPGVAKKVEAQVPDKIIVKRYVEAPRKAAPIKTAVPAKAVASVETPDVAVAPTPVAPPVTVAVAPLPTPIAPVETKTETPQPPVTELALAENASAAEVSNGPDLTVVSMIAVALTAAIAILGLSTLLFNRFGAVGAHGRPVSISFDPVGQLRSAISGLSISSIFNRGHIDEDHITSAHFAQMLGAEVPPVQDHHSAR